jgi:hypothetical protein
VWFLLFATVGLTLYAIFDYKIWYLNHIVVAISCFMLGLEGHVLLVEKCKIVRGRTLTGLAAGMPFYIGRELGQYTCVYERPTGFDFPGLFAPLAGVFGLFVLLCITDSDHIENARQQSALESIDALDVEDDLDAKKKRKKKSAAKEDQGPRELAFVSVDDEQ